MNSLSYYSACWGSDNLALSFLCFVGGVGAHHHTVRRNSSKFLLFKVSPDHAVFAVHHLFHGTELLETRSDSADFSLSDIDLLDIKFVTLGVNFALSDLTNSEVTFDEKFPLFREDGGSNFGSFSSFFNVRFLLFLRFGSGFLLSSSFFDFLEGFVDVLFSGRD